MTAITENFWKKNAIGLIALAIALGLGIWMFGKSSEPSRIAFIDSQRLLIGFKEAHKINKEIQQLDEKWRKDLKAAEDSLKVFMDSMTQKYEKEDIKGRKKLQDELALRNLQITNFERTNVRKTEELTQQKMVKVYEKINSYLNEYGKAKDYKIIFGTVNGSIVFGEGTSADITNEIIESLNKRYE